MKAICRGGVVVGPRGGLVRNGSGGDMGPDCSDSKDALRNCSFIVGRVRHR